MTVALYMDVNVPGPVTRGLRRRNVTVLTAQEDGTDQAPDAALMDRATQLGYVLFSHDKDMLAEAARRQRAGVAFSGLVYVHQQAISFGRCVDDLELLAKASDPIDIQDRVEYLPL
jgi:hypothetical protein